MYDRSAIFLSAHRDFEARAGKPIFGVVKPLGQLWKECLRRSWGQAKTAAWNAARLAHVKAQTPADRIADALVFEEAADRGYNANRAAALRAELATLQMAA
jgi:hypothetical protein